MNKRITIDLSEYEGLLASIKEKQEYIHECTLNGKIDVKTIDRDLFYKSYQYGYSEDLNRNIIPLLSGEYRRLLKEQELEAIESEELKASISGLFKLKDEWESDYKEKVDLLTTKEMRVILGVKKYNLTSFFYGSIFGAVVFALGASI